jgi:RNA polymerase sigma factor (sigma-70 family)
LNPDPEKNLKTLKIFFLLIRLPLYTMEEIQMQSLGMTAERRATVTETINAYSKRLMGFIRRRVKSDADAEDVMQDVFQQLVGHSEPIEQVTAWLFRVARNKITDRARKKKPEALEDIFGSDEMELGLDWTELFPEQGSNPETEYLRALFWEELATALNELPPEQKEIFIQHEMEGKSFKELSESTGESVNTLISRKRYAVLHLRDRLRGLRNELLNY